MYQYYLSIAGINILLDIDHSIEKNKEFHPFLTEKNEIDVHAVFLKCERLPSVQKQQVFQGNSYQIAVDRDGKYVKLFFESPEDPNCYAMSTYSDTENKQITVNYLESYSHCVSEMKNCFYLLGFESILLNRDKLCLHATCVDTALGGILFSGISGIGKSTQADLWCRYRNARYINGDKPIISKDNGKWMAWGSPYAGSSRFHVNDKCEISAIVLLKQAKQCDLRRLTLTEAFRGIWAGLTIRSWDTEFVKKASSLVFDLIMRVPVFEFCCTPDEESVSCLEQNLRKEIRL